MAQIKFSKDMTFAQFLYANYGFSYTREQEREANAIYLKLLLVKSSSHGRLTNRLGRQRVIYRHFYACEKDPQLIDSRVLTTGIFILVTASVL